MRVPSQYPPIERERGSNSNDHPLSVRYYLVMRF